MFHKRIIRFWWIPLMIILSNFWGSSESLAAEKKPLTWGTTQSTSGPFALYVVMAKMLNSKIPEINVTVRSTGGSVMNARLMEKGEIDIGVSDTSITWKAIHGKPPFEGKPFPDLRILHVTMTNPLQYVVSERSRINDIHGLEGKQFCPGMLGGGTEKMTADIFSVLGVHPKYRYSSYADALEAMKNETIVGFGKAGVPDSSILDIASAMKIRILSFSDDEIDKIVKNVVGLRKTVVPSGMYPGVGEFKTVEMEFVDLVKKDFPAEIANKWLKTIWENRAELKRAQSMFVGDRYAELLLGLKAAYLHPGTIKFLREIGLMVPKALVPPEMGEK